MNAKEKFELLKSNTENLPIFDQIYFSRARSESTPYSITGLKKSIYQSYNYAVKYFPHVEVCLIFNLKFRREIEACTSSINLSSEKFKIENALLAGCYYKGAGSKYGYWEKVLVIPLDLLSEVLQNIEIYSLPNEYDEGYNHTATADWLEPQIRERESITRLVRDADFRKKVLKAYGYECAICRCKIPEVIQAAHIIPVNRGGSDDVANGICLCANHHLMFDNRILSIDFQQHTLLAVQRSAQQMPWYQEFVTKYNSKIKERNYE